MKITAPNYFQCPNDLVDHWMPLLKEAELKILLIIIRKTFGWHKNRDRISLTQMEEISGLSKKSVCEAIKSLVEKGIILKEIEGVLGTEKVFYSLIISQTSAESTPPQCKVDTPPSVKLLPTKETLPKDTNTKERNTNTDPLAQNFPSLSKEEKQAKRDNVLLTQKQHEELICKYSSSFVDQCYETLSLYKHSKGTEYKSDYHAILKWVIDAVKTNSKPSKSIKIEKSDQDTPEQRKAQGGVRINSKLWSHYQKKGHNMEGFILDENA